MCVCVCVCEGGNTEMNLWSNRVKAQSGKEKAVNRIPVHIYMAKRMNHKVVFKRITFKLEREMYVGCHVIKHARIYRHTR